MFKILILLTGLYGGVPISGQVYGDFTYDSLPECTQAIETEEVKEDIKKMLFVFETHGVQAIDAKTPICVRDKDSI